MCCGEAQAWVSAAFGSLVSPLCLLMVLVRAGPSRISRAVVVFSGLSRTACQHACAHMAFPARAALPRIQEFDVGLIYHVCLSPVRRPMAVLCSGCRSLDAVQEGFHCNGVASLRAAGPTFQWPARPTVKVRLASVFRARSCSPAFRPESLREHVVAREPVCLRGPRPGGRCMYTWNQMITH